VRFRVNGAIYAFDDLPTLKKTEKHDIDVVIDRVKVRADLQQRLAESFEAALRLANGRAIAVEMEESVIENDSASRSNDEGYRPKEAGGTHRGSGIHDEAALLPNQAIDKSRV